jgi:hypothetical protein
MVPELEKALKQEKSEKVRKALKETIHFIKVLPPD